MGTIEDRVAARYSKEAASQTQWELGEAVLREGENHPALKAVHDALKRVHDALHKAAQESAGIQRIGGGHTEDGTLVVAHVVPALEQLSETTRVVAHQLRSKLGR